MSKNVGRWIFENVRTYVWMWIASCSETGEFINKNYPTAFVEWENSANDLNVIKCAGCIDQNYINELNWMNWLLIFYKSLRQLPITVLHVIETTIQTAWYAYSTLQKRVDEISFFFVSVWKSTVCINKFRFQWNFYQLNRNHNSLVLVFLLFDAHWWIANGKWKSIDADKAIWTVNNWDGSA